MDILADINIKIAVQVQQLFILDSKEDWINNIPRKLPPKTTTAEEWIWVDKDGFVARIGEDFSAAEDIESYPIKVCRLRRIVENDIINRTPF